MHIKRIGQNVRELTLDNGALRRNEIQFERCLEAERVR